MRDLLLPDEDSPTRALAALRRRDAITLLASLRAGGGGACLDVAVRLAQLVRTSPELVVDLLAEPTVAMWLRQGRPAHAAANLALELALRGQLGSEVEVPADGALVSPAHDLALTPAAGVTWHISDGDIEASAGGKRQIIALGAPASGKLVRVSAPFPAIGGGIRLALVDDNPLAHLEAHPDKHGNALSLGGHDAAEWRGALAAALALIARHLPGVHAEMQHALRLLVPVGYLPERHESASYREAPGAIYLTLHPETATLAEALVHEFQHGKLNLVSWHDPLLENAPDEHVRSPVRPDQRPLWGVLLAAHALLPVCELYRRMREAGDDGVRTRLAEVVRSVGEAMATLRAHARPTRAGGELLAAMEDLQATTTAS